MRKTIILGSLVALIGVGAIAQAKDVLAVDQDDVITTAQVAAPAVRDDAHERHAETRKPHRETRKTRHERHDEATETHDRKKSNRDETREHAPRR